jgi:hypothetical protein
MPTITTTTTGSSRSGTIVTLGRAPLKAWGVGSAMLAIAFATSPLLLAVRWRGDYRRRQRSVN